jgi:hypothetical protein
MKRPGWKDPFNGLIDHLIAGPGEHQLLSFFRITGNTDTAAAPDYTQLPLQDYLSRGWFFLQRFTGCYWNKCSFCPERAEGNPYVPFPLTGYCPTLKRW